MQYYLYTTHISVKFHSDLIALVWRTQPKEAEIARGNEILERQIPKYRGSKW